MAKEIGLLDVIEWQAWVDMESGRQLDDSQVGRGPISSILMKSPYPGDLSPDGNAWVVDQALEAIGVFDPSLIILHFANQSFRAAFGGVSDGELSLAFEELKRQVDRFLREAPDYQPLIIGLGGYTDLEGYIDLMPLDGLAFGAGMSGHTCGLCRPTPRDLEIVKRTPQLVRMVSREEFREEFGGCDEFYRRFPDYYIEMEKGWVVKCSLTMARHPDRLGRSDPSVPIHTELGEAEALEDIRHMVEKAVAGGKKVAVILGEGWSLDDFPYPFTTCRSRLGWFAYDLKSKLIAIFSGGPVTESGYPTTIRMYEEEDAYPFTVAYNEPSQDLLGRTVTGLSVAVGNRSILPHALFGADITLECYARYVYNYGSMAILQGRGLRLLRG